MDRDPTINCKNCVFRQCESFAPLQEDEIPWINQLKIGDLLVKAGDKIILEGHNSPHLYTLYDGLAFRYHDLEDGGRQILSYCFPGDFIGLQASLFEAMEHSVEALTDCRLCVFPRDKFWEVFEQKPSLAYNLTWLAANDDRVVSEELSYVGRRSALERVAFLITYLYRRSNIYTERCKSVLHWPLSQSHIADTLGLTTVHVSRMIKELKRMDLISIARRSLTIHDPDKLAEIASYDLKDPKQRYFI